ncbi:MAG: hypothetical protein U5K54_10635 [Cytophagales bacterium]|nr:hypothetical protein [Cytophagales bacterium]
MRSLYLTPWEWHSVMCLDSMNAKKYVGCEVNVGMTVEECWELVHTSERTGMPLMMLENVCYRRDVMAVLNMVRQNILENWFTYKVATSMIFVELSSTMEKQIPGVGAEFEEKGFSEAQWRTHHSINRNGDLIPERTALAQLQR